MSSERVNYQNVLTHVCVVLAPAFGGCFGSVLNRIRCLADQSWLTARDSRVRASECLQHTDITIVDDTMASAHIDIVTSFEMSGVRGKETVSLPRGPRIVEKMVAKERVSKTEKVGKAKVKVKVDKQKVERAAFRARGFPRSKSSQRLLQLATTSRMQTSDSIDTLVQKNASAGFSTWERYATKSTRRLRE